jgi:hypothetical protein
MPWCQWFSGPYAIVQGYDNGGYFHRVLHYVTCDDGEDDVTQAVDRRRVELVHPAIFILISCNAMPFSDTIVSSLFT